MLIIGSKETALIRDGAVRVLSLSKPEEVDYWRDELKSNRRNRHEIELMTWGNHTSTLRGRADYGRSMFIIMRPAGDSVSNVSPKLRKAAPAASTFFRISNRSTRDLVNRSSLQTIRTSPLRMCSNGTPSLSYSVEESSKREACERASQADQRSR